MKKSLVILLFGLFFSKAVKAQIEKVIVETYYIADSLDATDTIDGNYHALAQGSKTYRIYIDLKPGYRIKTIYGDTAHALKFSSTTPFFNNIDRPLYFGYQIKKNYFNSNPTLALDTWLTLGLATTLHNGVLKGEDTDGSVVGGSNNHGGTASVPGGLLKNNDTLAGIPLTSQDGLLPNTVTYANSFSDNGFKNTSNIDTTIFGHDSTGTTFISRGASVQQVNGVIGPLPDNKILVAQLTTTGNISFELNLELLDSTNKLTTYVAQSSYTLGANIFLSPILKYPPVCGCTDKRYHEYDSTFACNDSSACHTLKVFGCTDALACNYDPNANILLPNFCCYPGLCNDRDISLVCPDLSPNRLKRSTDNSSVYPNPVKDVLSIQLFSSTDDRLVNYTIYDAYDRLVREQDLGVIPGNSIIQADVADLPAGLYLFRVSVSGVSSIKKFIKD